MPGVTFNVDVSDEEVFQNRIRRASGATTQAIARASLKAQGLINNVIYSTFEKAASLAGEGFPAIYADHLLSTIDANPPLVIVEGLTLDLEFDFEELGTYDDFEAGFHYQATTTTGEKIDLPYQGQDLRYDFEQRYAAWLSKYGSIAGETYSARVAYWETIGVAPQWLLLNYGEAEYSPTVHPYPLVEEILLEGRAVFSAVMEEEIDRALQETMQDNYQVTKKTYLRDSKGRFRTKGSD